MVQVQGSSHLHQLVVGLVGCGVAGETFVWEVERGCV